MENFTVPCGSRGVADLGRIRGGRPYCRIRYDPMSSGSNVTLPSRSIVKGAQAPFTRSGLPATYPGHPR
jgi:hypothetical protein